jgi:hypothetical protein
VKVDVIPSQAQQLPGSVAIPPLVAPGYLINSDSLRLRIEN